MDPTKPLEFLARAQEAPQLSDRVAAAVVKGGMVTSQEVMRIAHEIGYTFTRQEFEDAVRRSIAERFAAGEQCLAAVVQAKAPLESSCAKGCLSLTTSWHPAQVEGA